MSAASLERKTIMRIPGKVELFLAFQAVLGIAFAAMVVFGLGDWFGFWS